MYMIKKLLRSLLLLPLLPVLGAGGADIDSDELLRIVSERTTRAENAVLKDYFAQKGLDEEQSRIAREQYEERKRAAAPDMGELEDVKRRLAAAQKAEKSVNANADARVRMALMGVREECFDDVLKLAEKDIARAVEGEGTVEEAIDGVLARIPSLAHRGALSTGSAGNFPRADTGDGDLSLQLRRARERHDNIAAAAIISRAAQKGISLR